MYNQKFFDQKKTSHLLNLVKKNYAKYQKYNYKGVPFRDKKDKIVYNLQNKHFEFIKVLSNKKILEMGKYFLNDPYFNKIDKKKPNFNLLFYNARSSGLKLDLHIDTHMPYKGKKTYMMQFLVLLEDSKINNGCTIVSPGSHKSGKFSNRKTKNLFAIEGKGGDLVIWDSRLWHGTGSNNLDKTRWALVITMGSWWIKPSMDITRSLPRNFFYKCSDLEKQILGFCSIPPIDEFQRVNTKIGYKNIRRVNN